MPNALVELVNGGESSRVSLTQAQYQESDDKYCVLALSAFHLTSIQHDQISLGLLDGANNTVLPV